MSLTLRVRDVEVFLRRVRTRMPFRYGKAEVTGQPYAHLRVRTEPDAVGVSAAALPPLWFDKRPGLTHDETIRDLLRSVAIAAGVYRGAPPAAPVELHRACEPEARRRGAAEGMNDLTAGFGVALLDEAVLDAACRLANRTFHQGLKEDLFGLGPELGALVPERPLPGIAVRHTVGLSDPIYGSDVLSPVRDGLPETLADVVRVYRPHWYKIKLSGDADAGLDRLRKIAQVLDRDAGDYEVTLDGNEQFATMEDVARLVKKIEARQWLSNLWERTAWIEQPVGREESLVPGVTAALRKIPKPVIIDESDGTDEAVDRALELGYKGISAKNCKGVYRTLHSFRRCAETGAILSSEDLMNIPVVPLHQDLCVAAALHLTHSERNGHHYIRAFEYFSPKEREAARREFPELYSADRPTVHVRNGVIDVTGINDFGFGVCSEPDWEFLERVSP
jgi:L-alanine-DL-glutamate epimerase-like enolase superfamily enzyme